jgi:uncharacterized protein YndB with AHSA1/START domain
MTHLQFTTFINRPPDVIFNLIADLAHYGQWLSPSALYNELQQISDTPIKLGTTYIDQGKSSTLQGVITEFQPPTNLTFTQGTRLKLPVVSAGLDIAICYKLEAQNGGTKVIRDVDVRFVGVLRLMQPILLRQISAENVRILAVMKDYLESH